MVVYIGHVYNFLDLTWRNGEKSCYGARLIIWIYDDNPQHCSQGRRGGFLEWPEKCN
jgi:hypothetical protein